MSYIQEVLSTIIFEVMGTETNNEIERYTERINLLYKIPLISLLEHADNPTQINIFISEAISYEKKYIRTSLKYLDICQDVNMPNMIQIFSIISYQLAISRWEGIPFSTIASFMHEYFTGFFEDEFLAPDKFSDIISDLSDIKLDFDYARFATDAMSLRTMQETWFLAKK